MDKVNLGKVLFWDEQLSSTRTVACGTCHGPEAGGADLRAGFAVNPGPDGTFGTPDDINGSPGVPLSLADGTYIKASHFGLDTQVTGRTAPSAINAAFNQEQFWDGRVNSTFKDPLTGAVLLPTGGSLEGQASGPPTGDSEMAHQGRTWTDCANRIAAVEPLAMATNIPAALDAWIGTKSYQDLFTLVYGDPSVTPARIIMAIATYERTLISDQTPFDSRHTDTPSGSWTRPVQQQGALQPVPRGRGVPRRRLPQHRTPAVGRRPRALQRHRHARRIGGRSRRPDYATPV